MDDSHGEGTSNTGFHTLTCKLKQLFAVLVELKCGHLFHLALFLNLFIIINIHLNVLKVSVPEIMGRRPIIAASTHRYNHVR